MKTGTNASIGPGLNPSSSAPCPSWKTQHQQPEGRAVESRLRRIALIGMTIERNATSSNRNESPRTKADDQRDAVAVEVDDVEREGRPAGDVAPRRRGGPPKTIGHELAPDLAHDVAVALVVLAAGHDVRHERHGAVDGRAGLERPLQAVDARGFPRSGGRSPPALPARSACVTTTCRVRSEPCGPFLVRQVDALDGIDRVGERVEVATAPCGVAVAGMVRATQRGTGDQEGDHRSTHHGADDHRPEPAAFRSIATRAAGRGAGRRCRRGWPASPAGTSASR